MAIIEASGLTKTYRSKSGPVHALAGLDLSVPQGTVKALLGPNGAGKTTTVKVLTTLITPDSGTATIDGIDVIADPQATRRSIGVSGQYAAVDENLTGFENLEMIGRLYHLGRKTSRERARELIDVFDLAEAGDRPVKGFSGGMRRRIDLAGALVMNPRVLFLDEPTTGLDPRSRLALWGIIEDLVAEGATVLLTTQYLEEADRLADDIAVIDDGRVIAEGTADHLKAQVGGHRVVVTLVDETDGDAVTTVLRRYGVGDVEASGDGRTHAIAVEAGPTALQRVLADLGDAGIELHDAGMRRPTLDDVFLRLTGHAATEDEADEAAATKQKETAR
ncbi:MULTISPECIES: ATP-binding cassette domain-containing protein [unclassified Curtobacterium]|uniref:ATP-binding cassette domain-containing protein n=1 Tax=unclassified Curtobacterium TaxID=257496 RepID=UPI000F460159|nr:MULTISPECIES: ATP-binding cassette domain-containing protein [unclassified Curtobacterium]ROS35377.1 ABC-2 type transport system ATP-binding protein [Curtobacterium sp. PhB78]RPE79317.1 ABC-2 type transport system ATP-binding protein [Curtobacterium sp. PhB137]TCL78097.1 ABC-2 type transport system ATP-binding protein [Curtobacterium sp. PhB128]TCL94822.1 ABC-2 type transport system ATP-binding protein [Curtobacterium sp. PhB138]TCU86621.1 ABC-2 type transport system ATP-binding protein [Cu